MNKIDLTGKRFGRLLVIEQSKNSKDNQIMWLCKCDCGNDTIVYGGNLRRAKTQSCGCGCPVKNIHGQSASAEYGIWSHMKSRCYNVHNNRYPNYGGRGIRVCDRWVNSFENFFSDMGKRPSPNHSIDRYPDTNGDYTPNNCRWATDSMQQRNTTQNRWIEGNGQRMILADWAKLFGIHDSTLHKQLNKKTIEDVYEYYNRKRIKQGKVLALPNSSY